MLHALVLTLALGASARPSPAPTACASTQRSTVLALEPVLDSRWLAPIASSAAQRSPLIAISVAFDAIGSATITHSAGRALAMITACAAVPSTLLAPFAGFGAQRAALFTASTAFDSVLRAPLALLAFDVEVPKNDGWVTDLAGMLTPAQEKSLEDLMESYRQGSKNEIALLTVPDLGGNSIERYATEVGRAWGIGSKETNNGALLVVSQKDRALRIEVGRGLEGNLTDSISGRIIRDVIVPQFKRGDYAAGLRKGIEAIHAAIGGEYGKIPAGARSVDVGLLGVLMPVLMFIFMMILVAASRRGRRRRRGMGPLLFPGSMIPPIGLGGFGGRRGGGFGGGGGGGFGGFGGGGGFSGGGASGRW